MKKLIFIAALFTVACANNQQSNDNSKKENEPKLLKVVKVEYYTPYNLKSQAGNTYEAKNLCDGNVSTAWAINLDDSRIYDEDQIFGPTFTLNCKKLSHIVVYNGYGKSQEAFKNNSRAAHIRFMHYDETDEYDIYEKNNILFDGDLKDVSSPQKLEIPSDLMFSRSMETR